MFHFLQNNACSILISNCKQYFSGVRLINMVFMPFSCVDYSVIYFLLRLYSLQTMQYEAVPQYKSTQVYTEVLIQVFSTCTLVRFVIKNLYTSTSVPFCLAATKIVQYLQLTIIFLSFGHMRIFSFFSKLLISILPELNWCLVLKKHYIFSSVAILGQPQEKSFLAKPIKIKIKLSCLFEIIIQRHKIQLQLNDSSAMLNRYLCDIVADCLINNLKNYFSKVFCQINV